MNHLFALVIAALLAGCGTQPPRVVNILIPCEVTPPEKPDSAFSALQIDADELDYSQALHIDRIRNRQYQKELEAAIQACR